MKINGVSRLVYKKKFKHDGGRDNRNGTLAPLSTKLFFKTPIIAVTD